MNININRDDSHLNDYLISFDNFGSRPNKIVLYDNYDPKNFKKIIEDFRTDNKCDADDNYLTEIIKGEENIIINDKIFAKLSENIYISYVQVNRNSDNHLIGEVSVYSKTKKDIKKIESLVDSITKSSISKKKGESEFNKLNTLIISNSQLEVSSISPTEFENFDDYYNQNTISSINKLIKKIKKKDKGMSILWGERGTGKTYAAKHISQEIDRMSVFIPNNMIDTTINNPDFKSFLERHPKLMLIIDDCEIFFNEAYTKANIFTNNMIQLVDGFLSTDIDIHILLIFNVEEESDIDHSLLECNNLIKVIEFEYLDKESSEDLSKSLGIKNKISTDMRLIDILNGTKRRETTIGLN